MNAIVRILRSDEASYAAIATYLVSRHIEFPGDWLLRFAALYVFVHARYERYRHASEAKKKRYSALGIGFFVFIPFAMLIVAFTPLLPLRAQHPAVWAFIYIELFYLIPATGYLIFVDRMKEPNKSPEPTTTSVMPAAEHPARRP